MASTSTSTPTFSGASDAMIRQVKNAARTIYSDNQSLIAEFRRAVGTMKEIAVELEKQNQTDLVKELEKSVKELLDDYENCVDFSDLMQSLETNYQPGPELTDFKKLFDDELAKIKRSRSSDPQNQQLLRQFREAVWNVHHAGQPMPGEEQADIVMTCTQGSILNITCPISGKSVTQLAEPVRSRDCKHIYEKSAVLQYIKSMGARCVCPSAGCPKALQASSLVSDQLLLVEIEELRSSAVEAAVEKVIEDLTNVAEDSSDNE
ncbi:E3 SUMO-protein ligase MMS21-like protein [Drosera capensis]